MHIRPSVEGDLDRILACRLNEPIKGVTSEKYTQHLAARSYRSEWTWIAEEGDRILARAVWWGFPEDEHPRELDCLYVDPSVSDPVGLCAQLVIRVVETAPPGQEQVTFPLLLPNDWKLNQELAQSVRWRLQAVALAGMSDTVERLRYEWISDVGAPPRSTRLTFAEESDEEAWVEAFRRVADGTLDAATRREIAHLGTDRAARNAVITYRKLPGRHWWRMAGAGKNLIGFIVPSRNEGGFIVGYIGVVPEHRGRGYVHDLLAETTHLLAGEGARRIVGDVDAGNTPMAAAFERAGYRNFAVRLVACQPAPAPAL